MGARTTFSDVGDEACRDSRRHGGMPRTGYVLAVSGVLAVVTFTLVYLTTLSFAAGF